MKKIRIIWQLIGAPLYVGEWSPGYIHPCSEEIDGSLLNTSNRLAVMKKYLLYWRLGIGSSEEFYSQPSFRAQLAARISNPSQQLAVTLFRTWKPTLAIEDLSCLDNVHKLILVDCTRIGDLHALGSVPILFLRWCQCLCGKFISNLSGFSRITDLHFCHSDTLVNVSPLRNLTRLTLSECSELRDVSALGNIRDLTIRWCQQVRDVSALRNIRSLTIDGCDGVSDVSALGGVHTLTLYRCLYVTDVNCLRTVDTLTLDRCRRIRTPAGALSSVPSLTITNCQGLPDVPAAALDAAVTVQALSLNP
jgi:hypothetical protein